jgi:hypothetical protein
MKNRYISIAQAWLAFCGGNEGGADVGALKLQFKREVLDPLRAATFKMSSFSAADPIDFKTWSDWFGGQYPRLWLQSHPCNVPLGDFSTWQADFVEIVTCTGHHFKFPSYICFERRAFDALTIWGNRRGVPTRGRGRPPSLAKSVEDRMRKDAAEGYDLAGAKEEELAVKYGVKSRNPVRTARQTVLSEINSRQLETKDN